MSVKTETITIKVTPEEKEAVKAAAAKADQTVSKYLYRLLIKNQEEQKNGST